ncbi:MAG: DUF5406 family protein [Leisingera sp.]
MPLNLDPNMNLSGRMSEKTIRLTFGMWDYRKTVEVKVGGNCSGLFNIKRAVDTAFEDHFPGLIVLERANGDKLECTDSCEQETEWLAEMLVSAAVIAVAPQST